MIESWFDEIAWAWLPGTLLGVFGGLWGSLVGVLAPHGKARPFVLGLGWLFLGVSLVLLAAGLTALASGQPYGVWYGLGLPGLLGTVVIAPLLLVVRKRYEQAGERRRTDGI
jgi:multidrug transporter EmrE-like cation transporter